MSNEANTQLLDKAYEIAERVLGTGQDKQIFKAIENNDLKEVERLIKEVEYQEELAWAEQFKPMTDETLEDMYSSAEFQRDARREDGQLGANDVY